MKYSSQIIGGSGIVISVLYIINSLIQFSSNQDAVSYFGYPRYLVLIIQPVLSLLVCSILYLFKKRWSALDFLTIACMLVSLFFVLLGIPFTSSLTSHLGSLLFGKNSLLALLIASLNSYIFIFIGIVLIIGFLRQRRQSKESGQ